MVSVTLEADSVEELLQQAAVLASGVSKVTAPAEEATDAPAKRGRPAKSPEQRATEAAEAQIEKSAAVKTALDAANFAGSGSPFTEVSEIISTLVGKAGKPATVKLLGEFEVKRASELKPEQYGPFLAAAKKLLS